MKHASFSLIRLVSAAAAASLLLALGFSVLSCRVHEWPDESTPADLRLDFVFATDLPPYLDIKYETKDAVTADDYDFRYTVKFYPQLPSGKFDQTEASEYTLVLTKDDVSDLNYSTVVSLPEGRWQIRCWADYVSHGSRSDLFYKTSNFKAIELPETHTACNDFKDAFLGSAEVDLVRLGSKQAPVSATLDMERPLGKFQFIATDLDKLVTKVLKSRMTAAEYSKYLYDKRQSQSARPVVTDTVVVATPEEYMTKFATKGDGSAWNPSKAPGFEPDDYYIRFYYTSFMPYIFNMFTNKPIDSRTGVQFDSAFSPISMDEVLMGFDYVLVNGHESSVIVQVALYARQGDELLSLTNPITVPLVRSKVTTVRGDFLNLGVGGGIGINPDFDDEFNIFI